MRLFLCIELSDAARQHLAELGRRWREAYPKASWVRAENLHVTLKFLGEVEDARVASLCKALEGIGAGGPLPLGVDHVECFPPRGPVRVIAAGLGGDVERLAELHGALDRRCAALGFPAEGRAYRAHVTLGRARLPLPAAVREELERLAAASLPGPEFPAAEFILMESRLRPGGPEYVPVARFPFGVEGGSTGP